MSDRPLPAVRRLAPEEWREYRALRLRALADAPDAFGSTLEVEEGRPDAFWADRLAAASASGRDLPLVAVVGGALVGLAWGRLDSPTPGAAHLYQMWVAPECRGLGVGRALLEEVVAWARGAGARQLDLRVTLGNGAAERLYEGSGFVAVGEPEPLRPGSLLRSRLLRLAL